jgi:membrane fusion protein (multidrug efflux system)
MRRGRIAIALLAAGLTAVGCSGDSATVAAPGKETVRVKVTPLTPTMFRQRITLSASAKASAEVTVAAEVAGRIVSLGFEKGDRVARREILATLDVAAVRAQRDQAAAARDVAALEVRKLEALAAVDADVSSFELETKKLGLAQAEANVAALAAALAKHTIRAPLPGVTVSRPVEIGSVVGPGAPITRIVDVDPIRIAIGVPETAVADFVLGKEATVVLDAFPKESFTGRITFLSPEVDARARTFACEVTLANPGGRIRPEMSAKALFDRKVIADALLIPQSAVLELPDAHAVFVVNEGNVARQKIVTIGDHTGEMALVTGGLSAGDRLVTTGHRSLLDGDPVTVVE